jgi:hypothetical protein
MSAADDLRAREKLTAELWVLFESGAPNVRLPGGAVERRDLVIGRKLKELRQVCWRVGQAKKNPAPKGARAKGKKNASKAKPPADAG